MASLNIDTSNLGNLLNGNKTYVTLAVGAAVVVANHFGFLPADMAQSLQLNPDQWLFQLWTLALGGAGRSALNKIGSNGGDAQSAPKSDGTNPA